MIMSLLKLDITSPSVRQCFRNCQDLHRNIMKAFDVSRSEGQILYRVFRSGSGIQIYVQSATEPHWERVEPNGFICEKKKDVSRLPESFHAEQVMRFTLFGCPSKKTAGEGKNSKRVLLRGEEAQLEWLKKQGDKYGFTILEAHVTGKGETQTGRKGENDFRVTGIPFEGVLQVKDVDVFCKAFQEGIGAEKAYGFGMLMVAKV